MVKELIEIFFETEAGITIQRRLRRTLVRLQILFSNYTTRLKKNFGEVVQTYGKFCGGISVPDGLWKTGLFF